MVALNIFVFIFAMWMLILIGGGIMVMLIGPLTLNSENLIHPFLNSAIKVIIALFLVFIWIFVLTKIKNWIFQKQIKN